MKNGDEITIITICWDIKTIIKEKNLLKFKVKNKKVFLSII